MLGTNGTRGRYTAEGSFSDNVLWHGKVLDPDKHTDESTIALTKFNKMIKEHPEMESVMLPVRDGITLSRKI